MAKRPTISKNSQFWDSQTDVHGRPPFDHDLLWESMATWAATSQMSQYLGEPTGYHKQPSTYCVHFGSFITGIASGLPFIEACQLPRLKNPCRPGPSTKRVQNPLGLGTLVHRLQAHLRGVPRVNLIWIIGKQQFLAEWQYLKQQKSRCFMNFWDQEENKDNYWYLFEMHGSSWCMATPLLH